MSDESSKFKFESAGVRAAALIGEREYGVRDPEKIKAAELLFSKFKFESAGVRAAALIGEREASGSGALIVTGKFILPESPGDGVANIEHGLRSPPR